MKRIVKSPTKLILAAVIIAVLFFGFSKFKKPTQKYTQVTAKRQNIESVLALSGSIDASSKATLQFQTSGQLAWVGVKVGDKVKKWQTIASLLSCLGGGIGIILGSLGAMGIDKIFPAKVTLNSVILAFGVSTIV